MIKATALALGILLSANVTAEANSMASKRNVLDILRNVSADTGLPFNLFTTFGSIESRLNPRAQTGSYKGLFQLSNTEFKRNGGGNIYDPEDNAYAFAKLVKRNANSFKDETGRNPTTFDLYMMHQQGEAGYLAHVNNPDQPAWKSMYSTGEGRQKGPGWSKKAIWGNLPGSDKREFGSVNNVTSQDFLDSWRARVERFSGGNGMNAVAAETGSVPLPGQRVTFPQKAPDRQFMSASLPEDRGVRPVAGGPLKSPQGGSPEPSIPMPAERRVALNSPTNKGYGQLPQTLDYAEAPSASASPSAPSPSPSPAPRFVSQVPGDTPWPGTSSGLQSWASEGLKPGAAIPSVAANNPSPGPMGVGAHGSFGNPPLFRNFFTAIFGGGGF